MKNGRSGEIRTPGPLVPNQMRYQAALHSDDAFLSLLSLFFKPSWHAKPVLFCFFPDQRRRIIGQPTATATAHLVARQI